MQERTRPRPRSSSSATFVSTLREAAGHPCAAVMYHYVREPHQGRFRGIHALSTGDFKGQLDWLSKKYRIISYAEFAAAILERRAFEEPVALLTFDDGLIDHYTTVFLC